MRIALLTIAVLGIAAFTFWRGMWRLNTPSHDDFPVRGIDVSHHQGVIDWRRVAGAGVAFAYIKASEGGDFRDRQFPDNWRGAAAVGIPRGAYHFFTLCSPGAVQAANFVAATPDPGELPPVVDLEFMGNCSSAKLDLQRELPDFLAGIRDHFRASPIAYTTYEFMNAYALPPSMPLWIRDVIWRPRVAWLFWQHHNRGHIDGIVTPVDLNVFHGDAAAFARFLDIGRTETN